MKELDQVCIFDLEYTTWPDAMKYGWGRIDGQAREVIEIAALILTPGIHWSEGETFNSLVKPVINPTLDEYAINLTGITQKKMDRDGVSTAEMLAKLHDFAGDMLLICNGFDRNALAETCGLQNIISPIPWKQIYNMRGVLYQKLHEELGDFDESEYPSGNLHKLFNIDVGNGKVHGALHDVYSLGATAQELEKRGNPIPAISGWTHV